MMAFRDSHDAALVQVRYDQGFTTTHNPCERAPGMHACGTFTVRWSGMLCARSVQQPPRGLQSAQEQGATCSALMW